MVMGNTAIKQRQTKLNIVNYILRRITFAIIAIYQPFSYAADFWTIKPSLTFAEAFSDNINLAPEGREQSAFITELSPGVSIRRNSARHTMNIDYRMQNLYNAGADDKIDIFNQLQANSNFELVKNLLFFDMNASIGQQNSTNLNSANNNFSGSGNNNTDVTTYGISPYWTPHFNGHVKGEVRFTYDEVMTDDSSLSDSKIYDYSVKLRSGRRFSFITWLADYNRNDQIRENGSNVKFEDSLFEVRGHINRFANVFVQVGHSKNQFQSSTNNDDDGMFYSVGGKWIPNGRLSLEGAIGNNSFAIIDIKPSRHMHWVTTYRHNKIGTNIGDIWDSVFDYKTKRSVWRASYKEETTTLQNRLLANQNFSLTNNFGNTVSNPVVQQSVQFNNRLPNLVDEVVITKKAEISMTYLTGKSRIYLQGFSDKTKFQQTKNKNNILGVNGSWDWNFYRRSKFFLKPAWQETTRSNSRDNRYDIAVGLSRQVPVKIGSKGKLDAKLEYRYVNQMSTIKSNEFIENRITANLFLTY